MAVEEEDRHGGCIVHPEQLQARTVEIEVMVSVTVPVRRV